MRRICRVGKARCSIDSLLGRSFLASGEAVLGAGYRHDAYTVEHGIGHIGRLVAVFLRLRRVDNS